MGGNGDCIVVSGSGNGGDHVVVSGSGDGGDHVVVSGFSDPEVAGLVVSSGSDPGKGSGNGKCTIRGD